MFRRFIICLSAVILFTKVNAQTDNELWFTTSADFDLVKKLDLNTSLSTRFDNNFSSLKVFNAQFGLTYKLKKHLDIGIAYRYTYKINSFENRLMVESKWDKEIIKRTDFSWRSRFQSDYILSQIRPENIWRNKFEIKRKIKKTKIYPSVFAEFFLTTNRFDSGLKNTRLGFAIDYKEFKDQTISLGYFKNKGLKNNRNIFTIDYKINF